ncbi:MAG: hypothetical protein ABMA64_23155 [Myxococcota bacterium]
MQNRRGALLVALALSGCGAGAYEPPVSPATFFDATDPANVEAVPTTGSAPNRVVVRALNSYGAAVPSPSYSGLTLDGVPVDVAFDGYGYGSISIEEPGHSLVAGAAGAVDVYTFDNDWPGLPLDEVWETGTTQPTVAVAVSTGMLGAEGPAVWWAGLGAPAHPVLVADGPIVGLRAENIDVDGVLDALAWTANTVFLLKGRASGGMAWGGGFRAPGHSIGGVDAGDLSADNLPDIGIAWVDAVGRGTADVWEGDGLFQFTAAVPRPTTGVPIGLEIADNTAEGLAQITVLHEDGTWSRFIRGAELEYMPIGPSAPSRALQLPSNAELLPTGDINDDGGDEIVVASQRVPSVGRSFWFVDVRTDALACAAGEADAQCGTEYLPLLDESGAYYAIGDANADYLEDVFVLHDTRALYAMAWDPQQVSGKFALLHPLDLPAYAPFDVRDLDRDGWLDLVLAGGPLWWTWHGRAFTDLERFWEPREIPSEQIRELLTGPFALLDTDADPSTVEIAHFAQDDGGIEFRVASYAKDGGRADLVGRLNLPGGTTTVDDLAICGGDVYVAVAGDVHRLSIANPAAPEIAATLEGSATRIDCGEGPSGTQLAVLDTNQVTFRQRAALTRIGDPVEALDVVDLALGDLGAGPQLHTCDVPGCSTVFWPSAVGPAFASTDASGTTIVTAADSLRVAGVGLLGLVNADGDPEVDLASLDPSTGLVAIHRATPEGFAGSELWRLPAGSTGPLALADGDGDLTRDVWWVDAEGNLTVTTSAPPVVP